MSSKSCLVWTLMAAMFTMTSAFCPRGCECDDFQLKTHCPNSDLDTVPILLNPGTRDLNLSHNRIKTVLHGFNFYRDLLYFDLSHNEIISLGSDHFAFQSFLLSLDVSNNKISVITNRAFVGLSSLANLVLRDNYVESIEPNALFPLTKLQTLDLSNNRLENVTGDFLHKQQHLKVLNLCKNAITNIPSSMLEQLQELQVLDVCFNKIVTINDDTFKNVIHLVKLSLSDNQIASIQKNASNGLELLEVLDLKNNRLSTIPHEIFSVLKSLEELDVSSNLFVTLPTGKFSELNHLKNLHISRCPNLTIVESRAFKSLSKLVTLELSFNPKLTILATDVFHPLQSLKHLSLRGNALTGVPRSVSNLQLQSLDLRGNKLHCNCSLKWLHDLMSNQSRQVRVEDVTCLSSDKKGKSLLTLNDYELDCNDGVFVLIACILASILLVLTTLTIGIIFYKNRRKMKSIVRDNWPDKILNTWRDSPQDKWGDEEGYTFYTLKSGAQHIPITVI